MIINGQDHEPVVLQVAHEVGEAIDLGTVESAATVFNPNTAPNASIGSVHNRGLSTLRLTVIWKKRASSYWIPLLLPAATATAWWTHTEIS